MRRIPYVLVFLVFFFFPVVAFSEVFKVYPGAKLDDIYELKQTEPVNKMDKVPKVIIFTTNDFFENVVAFYRGTAREYRMPGTGGRPMKLSSGQELREAYFILDSAGDIMTSKYWFKIQRPYLKKSEAGRVGYVQPGTVLEVTAIIVEDKRSYR